jgi:hypothetical protein
MGDLTFLGAVPYITGAVSANKPIKTAFKGLSAIVAMLAAL